MIADEAVKVQKFKKPAILADSTNYGQLGRADLEKALAALDVKPVATEKFNIGDTDMTGAGIARQGGWRGCHPDLRDRAGTRADRECDGKTWLESADDRIVDTVHGKLHRHGRRRMVTAR